MNINEIDKFRNNFFDKLIKEEQAKVAAVERRQLTCAHKYDIRCHVANAPGYQTRKCSKCGLWSTKAERVWRGTEMGTCSIS